MHSYEDNRGRRPEVNVNRRQDAVRELLDDELRNKEEDRRIAREREKMIQILEEKMRQVQDERDQMEAGPSGSQYSYSSSRQGRPAVSNFVPRDYENENVRNARSVRRDEEVITYTITDKDLDV